MSKTKQVRELTEQIIRDIETTESIELPLFEAVAVKNDVVASSYLGDKIIGFYFYARAKNIHFIKSIFDGCDYEINKETLKNYTRNYQHK